MTIVSPLVVKVGGSLYDLPDLAARLRSWFAAAGPLPLLVPGGGPTADVVRAFDACHRIGEETAHWLALRSLALNAHFLAALLPGATLVGRPEDGARVWERQAIAVLDAHAFMLADEQHPGRLPHRWDVTSDSVAARVAAVAGARQLVLLKSVTIPGGMAWDEAGRRGFVDRHFARVLAERKVPFTVTAVNLRRWRP
jgi:aspartokinase-like uncharacterized kinase